jgi:hypothetical protein
MTETAMLFREECGKHVSTEIKDHAFRVIERGIAKLRIEEENKDVQVGPQRLKAAMPNNHLSGPLTPRSVAESESVYSSSSKVTPG